jgi:hypothetical protein
MEYASPADGFRPADLILLCGVFGNISQGDIANTINHLPQLSAEHATVIWTRHRHPPEPFAFSTRELGHNPSADLVEYPVPLRAALTARPRRPEAVEDQQHVKSVESRAQL